ncbi:MAG: hypothetical protein JOZ87_25550 [Chloroflexi bacterium]|nr:hypothetical protein [Chloroflexota bacterium]
MILIVEGVDLVGKATLAERVNASRGRPIVKIRWVLVGHEHAETVASRTPPSTSWAPYGWTSSSIAATSEGRVLAATA